MDRAAIIKNQSCQRKGLTLIELLIALALLGTLVLAFSSIDLFSRYHVATSETRAQVQNEASLVLERMRREILPAVGNEQIYGANTVVRITDPPGNTIVLLRIYIDANRDGIRQNPVPTPLPASPGPTPTQDHYIAFAYDPIGPNAFRLRYCSRCRRSGANNDCTMTNLGLDRCLDPVETISSRITNFTPTEPNVGGFLSENNVQITTLTACLDPDGAPVACGLPDNPSVNMRTRIQMPMVSTN